MPYIKLQNRLRYQSGISGLVLKLLYKKEDEPLDFEAGELNFIVYSIMSGLLKKIEKRYSNIQKIIGAIELAVDEFKRRHLHPYEDEMIQKNGDI